MGGMAPLIFLYYWAVNIRVVLYWMGNDDDNTDAEWLNLERTSVIFTSLKGILCSKLLITQPISNLTSNPIHCFALNQDMEPV